jgi:hypothetical protein
MAWDIYGHALRTGHCEVHPHVAEEYPCSVCMVHSGHPLAVAYRTRIEAYRIVLAGVVGNACEAHAQPLDTCPVCRAVALLGEPL